MQPDNNTEKVVSKPETIGAIMAERIKEMGGVVPLHKMNRKARRLHYLKTGEKVVGSNKPHLNPEKLEAKVHRRLFQVANAMGLRYNPWQKAFLDKRGKEVHKVDFEKEVEAFKQTF